MDDLHHIYSVAKSLKRMLELEGFRVSRRLEHGACGSCYFQIVNATGRTAIIRVSDFRSVSFWDRREARVLASVDVFDRHPGRRLKRSLSDQGYFADR